MLIVNTWHSAGDTEMKFMQNNIEMKSHFDVE